MNKKLMVAAVAAAFVAPAALAQSSVTIGGTVNILFDQAKAGGATNNGTSATGVASSNDLKSASRVRDGAGSNIRFTVIEDLGGGNSAYVQVESAVIVNSDQRSDSLGQGGGLASGGTAAVWGNRNSAIGIRSKTAGRFLIGVWDVHYHETYAIDPGWIPANSAQSILGLFNTFGATASLANQATAVPAGQAAIPNASAGAAIAIGGRYSNVIKWDSPNWSGFSLAASFARPTDGAPPNRPGSLLDGKKNTDWNFAPKYENGGLTIQYSYNQDKDIANVGSATTGAGATTFWGGGAACAATVVVAGGAVPCTLGGAGGGTLWKITSNRLGARYKFANGFGMGLMWDQSKTSIEQETGTGATATPFVRGNSSNFKRTAWALPLTYDTGNHHLMATYVRANDWSGNLSGVGLGNINVVPANNATNIQTVGSNTGARMWSMGYSYNLSQRTNVSLSYARIRNDSVARYDFFANSSGIGSAAYGADPVTYGIGLRHTW